MKKLILSVVMLGMTSVLTACPSADGGTSPPADSYPLTVTVTGAATAPVKVTNTTSGAIVWNDNVTGSKTFTGMTAGSVLKVEGSAVNGYSVPAAQTVTMDRARTVELAYGAAASITPNATSITGKVTGNPFKIGNVYLGSQRTPFFIKGSVDASNVLTMNLATITPGDGDWFADFYSGCQGTHSNRQALTYPGFSARAYSPQGEKIGDIVELAVAGTGVGTGQTLVFRMYSSADWTFRGSCSFTNGSGKQVTEDVDVSVKKGWTLLMTTLSTSGLSQTTRNMAGDVRTELRFLPADPYVAARLNPSSLTFTSDAPVTVDAEFLQIGGYSGQVTLSTDRPGLTVEPATIALPPLPAVAAQSVSGRASLVAQLLQPQAVSTKLTFRYSGTDSSSGPFALNIADATGRLVGGEGGTVQISRPGFALSASECCISLPAGSTHTLNFSLYSQQGFAGNVTVTAGNLPAGVTATSAVVPLVAYGYAAGKVILTASTTAAGGTSRMTLEGTAGTLKASSALDLTVPAPTVTLSTTAVMVYAGETVNLPVTVQAQSGFEGAVNLSASGLPTGVSVSTKSVTLARNGAAAVNLALTGASTLGAASTTIKVTATATGLNVSQDTSLQTRTQRLSLGSVQLYGMGAAPAGGFWYVRQPYGSGTAGTLARFDGTKEVEAVALPYSSYNYYSIATSAAGEVWLATNGGAVLRYADGKIQHWDVPTSTGTMAVDAQGRLWMVASSSTTSSYALSRFNMVTGKFDAVVQLGTDYQVSYGPLAASRDGTVIFFYDSIKKELVRINTATSAASRMGVAGLLSITNLAVDAQGVPWLYGRGGDYSTRVAKVTADGTTNLYPAYAGDSLEVFGFDQGGTLWLASSGYGQNIVAFDPVAGSVSKTLEAESQSPRSALQWSGGVWRSWSDSNVNTSYVSLYK